MRLRARETTLAGAPIRRLLPQRTLRKVGPWVFLDHFGPLEVEVSPSLDVGPHPHCGLSTVSFLFEGAIEHRDSAGGHATVRPGEVHWMRAGHGIVHSERTLPSEHGTVQRRHGLQLWCAHPDGEEDQEPRFDSWTDLPELEVEGVRVQLLAGHGWQATSPVAVTSPLVYALVHIGPGQRVPLPDHAERCIAPISGVVAVDGERVESGELLSIPSGPSVLHGVEAAVVAVLGGAPIGARHIWWNLVHSDKERLRAQAERWRNGEFPPIPEDPGPPIPAPAHGP